MCIMFRRVNLMCNQINYRLSTIVFLIFLKNVSTIEYHAVDTHRLAKRMDLKSCLGQFDVHRNTIIRTGESQAIGGKYIQGIELDTLDECQRLCCETNSCDVYIFEDKHVGYCYLFECGPPENFHCKFTRHANYTSAVLTPVKHQAANPTTPRTIPHIPTLNISQQEMELTSLKIRPEKDKTTTTSPPIVPLVGIPSLPDVAVATLPELSSKVSTNKTCGRFQFKCHSGECIAVYNACDGIPQCDDGSDEGPECSGASSNSVAEIKSSSANAEQPQTSYGVVGATIPATTSSVILTKQQQVGQSQNNVQYQQTPLVITPPLINNREDPSAWANRKIVDAQQNEADRNSRIFSHKGGIQVPTNSIAQFPNQNLGAVYAPLPRGLYLQQPEVQSPFRSQQIVQPQVSHVIVPPNVNWPQSQSGQPIPIQGPAYIINGPQPQLIQPVHTKPFSPIAVELANIAAAQKTANSAVEPPKSDTNQEISQPMTDNKPNDEGSSGTKLYAESDEEFSDYSEKSTEPPRKKQRKHKKTKSKSNDKKTTYLEKKSMEELALGSPVHEQYKMIRENLELEYVDHDGQSERPSGAVLSLTLGLLVTAALGILIGCRIRTVGRRARRLGGKAPYAHDADFLVNGMYL